MVQVCSLVVKLYSSKNTNKKLKSVIFREMESLIIGLPFTKRSPVIYREWLKQITGIA